MSRLAKAEEHTLNNRKTIPSSSLYELLLLFLRRRRRFRVVERSMLPTLKPGDEILVDIHAYQKRPPTVGELVVASHPNKPDFLLIKRVQQVNSVGSTYLIGDNLSESTDSRHWGWIPLTQLLGPVTSSL